MRKSILIISVMILMIVTFSMMVMARVNINIDGNNIVKIMGDIHISEDREVVGDVIAILGDIKIDGRVAGDVVSILGDVEINNQIGGDLVSVLGNVSRGPEALVMGETNIVNVGDFNFRWTAGFWRYWRWNYRLFNLLILFGLAVLTFSVMPNQQKNMAAAIKKTPLRKLVIGLVTFLLLPIAIFLFAITILGIPLIPFLLLALIVARFIGYVAIVYLTGTQIESIGKGQFNIYLKLFLGVLALWILNTIPVLGAIFYLLITFLALGVIIDTRFGTNRPWFKKKVVTGEDN